MSDVDTCYGEKHRGAERDREKLLLSLYLRWSGNATVTLDKGLWEVREEAKLTLG